MTQPPTTEPAPPTSSNLEDFAKKALAMAADMVTAFSPLGGLVVAWATEVAFEIYDLERTGASQIAVAQLAGDRTADLVEKLKVGG